MNRRTLLGIGLLAVASGLLAWSLSRCGQPTTLWIVRHADRDGKADALEANGRARARQLVHVLERVGVAAIYRSDTNRARDTASPLGAALGLTPQVYAAANVSALVEQLLSQHRGQSVVVVGHSNTVPQLIAAAGGPSLPMIDEKKFDDLFMLSTCACGTSGSRLIHLQYGARSP